jgi:hypothetical protein
MGADAPAGTVLAQQPELVTLADRVLEPPFYLCSCEFFLHDQHGGAPGSNVGLIVSGHRIDRC